MRLGAVCTQCRKWRCQFCTLKFPLMGVRKVLPKVMKGNTRICLQCFNHYWHQNGLTTGGRLTKHVSLPEIGEMHMHTHTHHHSHRGSMVRDSLLERGRRESLLIDDVWAGNGSFTDGANPRLSFLNELPDTTTAPKTSQEQPAPTLQQRSGAPAGVLHRCASGLGMAVGDDPNGHGLISAIDLWMSLFAASILLVIAVADGFSFQQRVCYCVATYGLFLTLHPWLHTGHRSNSSSPDVTKAVGIVEAADNEQDETPAQLTKVAPSGLPPIPKDYLSKKKEIESVMAYYMSPKCPWKKVRSSETCTIYELPDNKPPYLFKLVRLISIEFTELIANIFTLDAQETFVTGISMTDFMTFIRSRDAKDRAVWDVNNASFEMIEEFDCQDASVSVCVNTQQSFLGGLVAPRDFCLLYIDRPDMLIFTSIEHPKVPQRPGVTRGHVNVSMFTCEEAKDANGTPGFVVTNFGQADIRGSLPGRMLYKGTMDNMENVLKIFRDAGKLFRTAPRA